MEGYSYVFFLLLLDYDCAAMLQGSKDYQEKAISNS